MTVTVQDFIDQLNTIEDKSIGIEIALRVYNKAYPIYCDLMPNLAGNKAAITLSPFGDKIRIHAYLNDKLNDNVDLCVVERKKKPRYTKSNTDEA